MKYHPVLSFLVIMFSNLINSSTFARDIVSAIGQPPILIGGPYSGTIIGNGGEPYGNEFSRIIRVEIYDFLVDQFEAGTISKSNRLYILKDKMAQFKKLLDDREKIYAVGDLKDIYGQDVFARIVPKQHSLEIEAHPALQLQNPVLDLSSNTLTLTQPQSTDILNKVVIKLGQELSYVQIGSDVTDSNGNPLPPGLKFYANCSQRDEIFAKLDKETEESQSIKLLCSGYRIDGTIATIEGKLNLRSQNGSLVSTGSLNINLYQQFHVIHVNQTKFENMLATFGKEKLQKFVFHEYLRLLGVDDNGYQISSYISQLKKNKNVFPFIGAKVRVEKGIAQIQQDDENRLIHPDNMLVLNPITYKGTVEKIYQRKFHIQKMPFVVDDQIFHVIDTPVPITVILVRLDGESSIAPKWSYYFKTDLVFEGQ